MSDQLTLSELGLYLQTMKVAYVVDVNNMTNSWLMAASKLVSELRVATPKGYEVPQWVLDIAKHNSKISCANLIITDNPKAAISGADVVTTDTWVSMGQEDEKEKRINDFAGYCVDDDMMSLAAKDAKFLHCLPAYRGYEVSEAVFEAHAGEIFSEAENRLHAQKAVMVWCDRKRYE